MPVPYGNMLHIPPTNLLLLTGAIQESLSLNEKDWKNFLEKVQQNGPAGTKKMRQKEC